MLYLNNRWKTEHEVEGKQQSNADSDDLNIHGRNIIFAKSFNLYQQNKNSLL